MKILERVISRAVYLLIFILPFQTRYFLFSASSEYLTYSIYAVDVILLLVAILGGIRALVVKEKSVVRGAWLVAALIELFILLSVFLGLDWRLSLSHYLWFLGATLLVYLLTKIKSIDRRIAWRVFLLSAILPALLGWGQFLNNYVGANKYLGISEQRPETLGVSVVEYQVGGEVARQIRAYGPFGHPNMFGGFLAVALLSAVVYFQRRKECPWYLNRPRQFVFGSTLYLALISSALLLSFSRAAILAAAVSLLVYFIFSKPRIKEINRRELIQVLIPLVAFIIFLSVTLMPLYLARLDSENRLGVISQTERLAGYSQAKKIITSNIFMGVGLGNYTQALSKIEPSKPSYYYQPVHNVFLLLLAELGIGMLVIVFWLIWVLIKYWRGNEPQLAALAVLLLILSSLDHWLVSFHFGWLFLGLIFSGVVLGIKINQE